MCVAKNLSRCFIPQVCRQMDDLLKSKEAEMEELKAHAKSKIAEAKKKMQDLIETAKKRESVLKEKAMQVFEPIKVAVMPVSCLMCFASSSSCNHYASVSCAACRGDSFVDRGRARRRSPPW